MSALAGLAMLGAALAALPKGFPRCSSKDSAKTARKKWEVQGDMMEKLYDKTDEFEEEEAKYRAAARELRYEYFMMPEPPGHKAKHEALDKKADALDAKHKEVYKLLREMRVESLKCVDIWDAQ